MFSTHRVEWDMPSTTTKQVEKGKEKVIEAFIHDEENLHETKHEFQLIDLNEDEN